MPFTILCATAPNLCMTWSLKLEGSLVWLVEGPLSGLFTNLVRPVKSTASLSPTGKAVYKYNYFYRFNEFVWVIQFRLFRIVGSFYDDFIYNYWNELSKQVGLGL